MLVNKRARDRHQMSHQDNTAPADVTALLNKIHAARGVTSAEALNYALTALISPDRLGGLAEAVDVLYAAFQAKRRILVVGDFDADGATSCALAVLVIRAMGHSAIDYIVPNRFTYSYGLTPEIVEQALTRKPELIITVDNGISSLDGVAAAIAAGVQVIVTDHHLPGEQLPAATAIVNPNVPGDAFPSKALAGVGVIFYVLLGLRARLRQVTGWSIPNMADYLDLVALGTVADVVPLDHNNRILVKQGLQRMRAGQCRPGILALLAIAKRDHRYVQAADLGFAVGPRLNAAGRLDDMSLGIECLLAEDWQQAQALAQQLDSLNQQRRQIEHTMQTQALAWLADYTPQTTDMPWGLSLYQPDWHQGVIGILASRLKERYHRPVIAFAAGTSDTLKGSVRSIPGLHIRDLLDSIAAQQPDLLQKFGGHAMAAGLVIRAADFARFSMAFDTAVRRVLTADDLQLTLLSDGTVAPALLNLHTAQAVQDAGPWGQGFPEPLFEGEFEVLEQRILSEKHWKMVLGHPAGDLDAIAFNAVSTVPILPQPIKIAYHLDVNRWRDQTRLQLRVEQILI